MRLTLAENLKPERVLYQFDRPLIFTARDTDNSLLFVYQCGEAEDESANHYLIAPFDDDRLADLVEGRMPVLEALSQPWIWHATGDIGRVDALEMCSLSSLPDDVTLPHHSVMLWPSLEPLLSFRLVGEHIRKGEIPGTVVRQGIAAPTDAIKGIANYLTDRMPEAEDALHSMTDVRVQRITYASFDVGLKVELPAPLSPTVDPAKEMKRLLSAALEAASQADYDKPLADYFDTNEEGKVILHAVRDLTPPMFGVVTSTQVGGRLVRGGYIRELSRDSRKYVLEREGPAKAAPETIEKLTGYIREIDLDKRSFILREISGVEGERKCRFEEQHEEECRSAGRSRSSGGAACSSS